MSLFNLATARLAQRNAVEYADRQVQWSGQIGPVSGDELTRQRKPIVLNEPAVSVLHAHLDRLEQAISRHMKEYHSDELA